MPNNSQQGNEAVCLCAYNLFAVFCILMSSASMYYTLVEYSSLDDANKELCSPLVVWKVGLLAHIIYFFMMLSFSVGAVKSMDDNERGAAINDTQFKFSKVLDASMFLCRNLCLLFCGPFIMIECVISGAYYD